MASPADHRSNSAKPDPSEVVGLARRVCEQTIDADERHRLEEMLATHPELRREYLDYVSLHAELVWRYRSSQGPEHEGPGHEEPEQETSNEQSPSSGSHLPTSVLGRLGREAASRGWLGLLSMAALLAVMVYWLQQPATPDAAKETETAVAKQAAPRFVATLREATSAVWGNEDRAVDVGARVDPGKLRMSGGEAELVLDSGARLLLAGPVELDIESPLSVLLIRGTVAAHMPPEAVGFELRTPMSKLIDQGTEFGVVVGATGSTQVHVFKGQVDLHYESEKDANVSATLAMRDRQAREISQPGTAGEEILFSREPFGDLARRVAEPLQWRVSDGGNDHYYQLVVEKDPLSWHEAARRAMDSHFRGMPGHLVSVTSEEEDCFVVQNLLEGFASRGVWIGLTDVLREGHFRWVTGEPFEYTRWATWPEPQPDNFHEADWHGGEDYGMYTCYGDKQPWAWNDLSIDSQHEKVSAYLIEYEPPIEALRQRSMSLDPIHWPKERGGNGHYYRVVLMQDGVDWRDIRNQAAATKFLGVSGQLVSLESAEERRFVAEDILRVCGIPEVMIGLSGSLESGALTWVSGEAVEGFDVERPHLPTDEVYGLFRWNPAGRWQTGWEITTMAEGVLPAGWFGYIVEYPIITKD